ncbi:hypothetical protein HK105_200565 [Polyrhizophydium stewartii]|uniref:Disease resistance R13L4/SHOC-2-like LRR domain-containing protein n=1 Tax=Polyrhizophydium stewartii TaxID=2732419 RepID=A0ABR4NJJ9_9FUNG
MPMRPPLAHAPPAPQDRAAEPGAPPPFRGCPRCKAPLESIEHVFFDPQTRRARPDTADLHRAAAAAAPDLGLAAAALPQPFAAPPARLAVLNTNPNHTLDVTPEIDRDQDLLDTLPLLIPHLQDSFEFETRYTEERLAADPSVETLTFGQLASLADIGACSQSLFRISRNVGLLFHTRTMQICCNNLTEIPAEIGYLKNLTMLSVAFNNLTSLPDTIGLLPKLVELRANNNQLSSLPGSIGGLSKLAVLHLESNRLRHLPTQVGVLENLVTIDVSSNPISALPAELARIKGLRQILAHDCPLDAEPSVGDQVLPSLKELAARTIVRLQLPILSITQPEIKDYLASAHECSFCAGPYFDSFTPFVRIVDRNRTALPLEYRLCIRHWSEDQDRLRALFAPRPATAPSPLPPPLVLPSLPHPTPPDSPDASMRRRKSHRASHAATAAAAASGAAQQASLSPQQQQQQQQQLLLLLDEQSVALPLSAISKSPSLPSLPMPLDQSRKPSASHLFRKTALIASSLRASRSRSLSSVPASSASNNLAP